MVSFIEGVEPIDLPFPLSQMASSGFRRDCRARGRFSIVNQRPKKRPDKSRVLVLWPRGVGKTTTARILARSVNCAQGITAQPCGVCSSCIRIIEGNSLDCIEIDAASHRGIDDIRDLREKVKYSPIESRFKVYIIDEVHMLTTEAFNALLKTLEEPPAHAIFILATTEPHRLPDTILSRCLRINFNSIENEAMVQHLSKITNQEGFSIEEAALYLIAQNLLARSVMQ